MKKSINEPAGWLEYPLLSKFSFSWQSVLIAVILLVAIVSRFVMLDERVMSHDETIHVYHNSWSLYRGTGYQHDPLSHGPLQTHLVALSYFLFGDSDFSARIPAALFGIAAVLMVWNYRRYIGRTGAIVAMILMVISPFMLYYGRYVRNDIYSAFFGIVMLWSILRYLETGKDRYTYYLSAVYALHFASKETSFIYAAQVLIFLALYFVYRMLKNPWSQPDKRNKFMLAFTLGLLLIAVFGGLMLVNRQAVTLSPTETVAPAIPGEEILPSATTASSEIQLIIVLLSVLAFSVSAYFLISGYSWDRIRDERSFGLLILLGTFVIPQLSPFLINYVGWNIPTNASQVKALNSVDIFHIGVFFVPIMIFSVIIGLIWNRRLWLKNAVVFYGIFIVLYTTVFTNGAGFFTGMIGSLGYWLEQQGVKRGSQPWYYYLFVQIPVYEYLAAIASIAAIVMTFFGIRPKNTGDDRSASRIDGDEEGDYSPDIVKTAIVLLGFWAVTSMIAYTIAGEKMPWLTVHLAWPLILCGSWVIGYLIDITDWSVLKKPRGWLTLAAMVVLISSGIVILRSLLGTQPPFQGKTLENLQATSTFLVSVIVFIGSIVGLFYLVRDWNRITFLKVIMSLCIAILAVLTARTAYQASFINYDYANELLVYAHSASGVKTVMDQVEEVSLRTTDGLAIPIAFDGEYPFWWYLRRYSASTYFGQNPTRSLRDNSIIIVGEENFGKIEPIVGQGYNQYDYIRLWWPNQDYFNLTFDRVFNAIANPEMREALFDIWLDRDYTKYGEVTGKDMSYPNWSPSSRIRLYIRKDIVAQLWNYGVAPSVDEIEIDPYEGKQVEIAAEKIFGSPGTEPGQFQRPRGIAIAPDGSIYIADTENSRIQHLDPDGTVLNIWGEFADITSSAASGGTFNQPWGIAVDDNGFVYVADTWNHRIQKFTAEGEFELMWGYFGQAEQPEAFWGPRDVAVDAMGRVYITDTGNKRVAVFDGEGNFISEFGGIGYAPGEFDEPVGIDIGPDGGVYVVDTWNQRIQVFIDMLDEGFLPIRDWDVVGWYGQSLDNKPFVAVGPTGDIFATDPEGYRVLQFQNNGELVRFWGDFGSGANNFGLAGAVAVDQVGGVWVTDTGNSRIMYFNLQDNTGFEN